MPLSADDKTHLERKCYNVCTEDIWVQSEGKKRTETILDKQTRSYFGFYIAIPLL